MQVIKAAYSSGFLCFDDGSIYGVCAICIGFGRLILRRRYKDLISGVEKVVISGFNLSSDPSTSTADTLLVIWHLIKPTFNMQFLLLLAATLSLGAGALASPAPVPNSLDSRAYHWHGCGAGIEVYL